jgi:phosphotriesterase-related protein
MKRMIHLTLCLLAIVIMSCSQQSEQIIMTVNGPIPASQMGITLSHEHVLVDFIGADSTGYHRWDRQDVVKKVLPFLAEIQEHHVSTLVECTPAYIGRDPLLLKELSDQTGMHLLTNTGYYGARNNHFIPAEFYHMNAEELSRIWIREFENGIEESGIKPGFIKIGVDGNDTLSGEHKKIITAAALTHQKTGLVIASHTGPEGPAFEQISILQSHDIDPSCFIWVHAQHGSLEGNLRAAALGCWISLDNVNLNIEAGSDYDIGWYVARIQELKNAGYLKRVLVSHDAGWYKPEEADGGTFRGFTDIFTDLIPALEDQGFTQDDIHLLLEVNPANAFAIKN